MSRLYSIDELVTEIYEDNLSHFDDRDSSEDCDCNIHTTIKTIIKYWEWQMAIVWEFKITNNMLKHMDDNEVSLFFNALEDSIEQICETYDVEPWEMSEDA